MMDYVPVILRAVGDLATNDSAHRKVLYERAWLALAGQLSRITPTPSPRELVREQIDLAKAIWTVESRYKGQPTNSPRPNAHSDASLLEKASRGPEDDVNIERSVYQLEGTPSAANRRALPPPERSGDCILDCAIAAGTCDFSSAAE
jgi:hypothetical protein